MSNPLAWISGDGQIHAHLPFLVTYPLSSMPPQYDRFFLACLSKLL